MTITIAFAGISFPAQFGRLHAYLNESGLAKSYFFTTPNNVRKYGGQYSNLVPFTPDGPIGPGDGYYFSRMSERCARISRGLHDAVAKAVETSRFDVIVGHSTRGSPHLLYGEIDAAIVSYMEFPSYHAHGWDPDYPPDKGQRMTDRNMEMLHYYQAAKSDLSIVPSAYAKSMFPSSLQAKIEVQMEGFSFRPDIYKRPEKNGPIKIGFAARDLSNAKGLHVFFRVVDRLAAMDDTIEFVVVGDPSASTYSYEPQWIKRNFDGVFRNYLDMLRHQHPVASRRIEHVAYMPEQKYRELLSSFDVILYPLQYGVGNWGLLELMAAGCAIVAPARGYTGEYLLSDRSALLVGDSDDDWVRAARRLIDSASDRERLGRNAQRAAQRFSLEVVASNYMRLFKRAIENKTERRSLDRSHW